MANTVEGMRVIPSGSILGAEIIGIDFTKTIPEEVAKQLNEFWRKYKVLLMRNQHLSKDNLYYTANVLGGVQETGSRAMNLKAGWKEGSARISDFPGISYISNLDENGNPVLRTKGSGSLEIGWHTDNSYMAKPPRGSILNAVEVPIDGGGHTSFLDAVEAYRTMSDDLKSEIEDKNMCHDNSHSTVGQLRAVYNGIEPTCREEVDGPVHPLVRILPHSGERALYISRRHAFPSAYIVELDDEESENLQDRIWAHIVQDKFTWTHSDWQKGDLIMWDNEQVLHKRSAVDPKQKRFMQRTLVRGEGLISAWET